LSQNAEINNTGNLLAGQGRQGKRSEKEKNESTRDKRNCRTNLLHQNRNQSQTAWQRRCKLLRQQHYRVGGRSRSLDRHRHRQRHEHGPYHHYHHYYSSGRSRTPLKLTSKTASGLMPVAAAGWLPAQRVTAAGLPEAIASTRLQASPDSGGVTKTGICSFWLVTKAHESERERRKKKKTQDQVAAYAPHAVRTAPPWSQTARPREGGKGLMRQQNAAEDNEECAEEAGKC